MQASAVGTTNAAQPADNRYGALTSDDFIKIMVAELSSQDPFEPVKNQDLINQISNIRSLEMNTQLNDTLKSMAQTNSMLAQTMQTVLLKNNLSSASGLIGHLVEGRTAQGELVAGRAVGVVMSNGEVMVQLDGGPRLGVDNVSRMLDAGDYMGRLVVAVDMDGIPFAGEVTRVRAEGGQIVLDLNTGRKIAVSAAAVVIAPEDLMGRLVTGRNGQDMLVQGLVTEIRRTDQGVMLELDTGETISLQNVVALENKGDAAE